MASVFNARQDIQFQIQVHALFVTMEQLEQVVQFVQKIIHASLVTQVILLPIIMPVNHLA
jgi:hypothetical protein